MKKFLITAISLMLVAVLLYTAYYQWGLYINVGNQKEVTSFATTEGKEILVDTGSGPKPYEIKGVNLGAGIPAHFATDYAIDKKTYLRWFRQIKDMGANTIRVYTILSKDFYDAVYEYNNKNPDPLYILHGVWVDDYVQNSRLDAYDDNFFETLKKDCRTLVDIIHGRKRLNLGYGTTNASGSYNKDISPWVLGYILGVEWEDVTVAYTDQMQKDRNQYQGKYMYTSKDATPFEAMLAQVGDAVISYESSKYGQQRLIAFSNWPTTDPFDYAEDTTNLFLKCAKVDVEHILTTDAYLSGQFVSYHAYPYYPDYLQYDTKLRKSLSFSENYRQENGKYNTYGIYLEMLNQYHTMPVIISEFGVPSSRGMAQADVHTGRSQGFLSEQEQGQALVDSYYDIRKSGCAGGIVFTWQDEWFKRTWNTMANVDLTKTAFWSDYQTNEQYFGLLSFDPGKEESVCYTDGDAEEWSRDDLIVQGGGYELSMKYDEKYIYFRIYKENLDAEKEKLYIPLDITPKTGSYYVENENVKCSRQIDFLMILDGRDNSRILVQERYDPFRVIFAEDYNGENPYFDVPDRDSPVFQPIYLVLQIDSRQNLDIKKKMIDRIETGKLTWGNGNPKAEDFNSVSDVCAKGDNIEIRLPWQLLNFANPSEMQIHDDYYEHYGIEYRGIDRIYAGIGAAGENNNRIELGSLALEGWKRKPAYHERLKRSYYMMQELWKDEE